MPTDSVKHSSRGFFSVVARGWAIILGAGIVLGLGALLFSLLQKPIYEATTTLYITSGTSVVPSAYDAVKASEERIQSYSQLIYSDAILGPAIKSAGLNMSIEDAKSAVRVEQNPQIVLLTLGARDHNPEVAQRLANAIADSMVEAVSRLEVPGFGGESTAKINVVTTATVGSSPVYPETPLNVAMGVLVGLILGLGGALIRERFNDKVRDDEDAVNAVGAPVLATVPAAAAGAPTIADFAVHQDPTAVAFRRLRSAFAGSPVGSPTKAVLVTSARQADDTTRVAVNVGAALAHASKSVVVVDADFRNPSVAELTGCAAGPGLGEAIANRSSIAEVVQPGAGGIDGLSALTTGSELSTNPDDVAFSKEFATIVGELATSFDQVIVDAPALLDNPSVKDLIPRVQGVLIVARRGVSRISDLRACAEGVAAANGHVLGIVFTE